MKYRMPAYPTLSLGVFLISAIPSTAQFDIEGAVKRGVQQETNRQVENIARNAVRCTFDNLKCIKKANKKGKPVVLTDENGQIITDADGNPITDPNQLDSQGRPTSDAATKDPSAAPGGMASTYDFEPGNRELFVSDFTVDNPGDFPRGLAFVEGNMQVVEWEDRTILRNDSKNGAFAVQLPETLPDQFTIEFEMYDAAGVSGIGVALSEPTTLGWAWSSYYGSDFFRAGHSQGSGIWHGKGNKQVATTADTSPTEGFVPVRIMVDGAHAKMFIGERRVANAPKTDLPRSDKVYFFMESRPPEKLTFITDIRIAAGGRDLYDALEADGRVAVRDILFDTNSATIRSESRSILEQIGTMMQEHPELNLMIEGHTDNAGEFDWNMELSGERAKSVKSYLVENFGIDSSRMRSMGLGQTQPVDTNDTDVGRQKNRRVELVKF